MYWYERNEFYFIFKFDVSKRFREGSLLYAGQNTSGYFSKETLGQIKNLKPSDKVSITDLHALGTDYRVEHQNDINLTLN